MIMCSWNFNLNYILPLRPYNLKVLGHKYPYKISLKYLVTFCAILQVIIFDVRSAVTTPEVLGYFCSNIRTHWFDQTGSTKPVRTSFQSSTEMPTLWRVKRWRTPAMLWRPNILESNIQFWTMDAMRRDEGIIQMTRKRLLEAFCDVNRTYDVICIRKCQTRIKFLLTDDIIRYKYVMTSL